MKKIRPKTLLLLCALLFASGTLYPVPVEAKTPVKTSTQTPAKTPPQAKAESRPETRVEKAKTETEVKTEAKTGAKTETKTEAKKPAPFAEKPEVRAFIEEMRVQHKFEPQALQGYFSNIRSNAVVLEAIAPAVVPKLKSSWQAYRQCFINKPKIAAGLAFWQKNEAMLAKARQIYGVPPEIAVAILGIETGYGKNTGPFGALEALATLAFDYPPRAAFFKGELAQLLLLARENGDDPLSYKSSYAGAIGIPQFMPSSYRLYAADFDGDGKIDLRRNPADAIGSVARFLSLHGWQAGETVALPVGVKGDPAPLLAAGILPSLSPQALEKHGVQIAGGLSWPAEQTSAALIDLAEPGAPTEYWIGFNNFYAITRYNRSSFYAMSVFQLSEALRAAKTASEAKQTRPAKLDKPAKPVKPAKPAKTLPLKKTASVKPRQGAK